ncbi:MAG: hypothetical protein ACKVOM_01090 [Ferruginibacter sp.]
MANHTSWDNIYTQTNPEFFVKDTAGNFLTPYDWDDFMQIHHSNEDEQAAMIDAMLYCIDVFDIYRFRTNLAHLTPLHFWVKAK